METLINHFFSAMIFTSVLSGLMDFSDTVMWRSRCTFQILGGCQGRRTGVGVTTVSNSLMFGGWVTKVLKNGDEKWGGRGWKGV